MIVVVGGGPAGCMAAWAAAREGVPVVLLEQNEKIGKKWYITGKGRCNLTNDQDMPTHLSHVRRNPKFLWGAYARYTKDDIQAFFRRENVPLKTERGDRVFPQSDKSSDTIQAFERALRQEGVQIRLNTGVLEVKPAGHGFHIRTKREVLEAGAVVLATGGLSYPSTGATGDGYRLARAIGHTVTPTVPSLVGLNTLHPKKDLAGLSLKNVELRTNWGKKTRKWFGEMLFTHYGISGPIVLQMSAEAPGTHGDFPLFLNLKPALSPETLENRLLREMEDVPAKEMHTVIHRLLPSSLVTHVLKEAGIAKNRKAGSITMPERKRLAHILQNFPLDPDGFRGFNEAIITRGGVNVREVDAKTMMSKKREGLFFAGEMLDVDADTGGYNMQIAWSTGFVAGKNAANYVKGGEDDQY